MRLGSDLGEGDLYCLVGGDVSASPSPAMMNAAFSRLSIAARYFAVSLGRDGLRAGFSELRARGVKGMNVTIPFKSEVVALLDGLDDAPARMGAVNTVKNTGGRLIGYNTDVEGVIGPLDALKGGRPESAVVVGAGGAARAFVEAMHRMGCGRVSVLVRERNLRARRFLDEMKGAYPSMSLELRSIAEASAGDDRAGADLLFNASPIGGPGADAPEELLGRLAALSPVVFDAVYRPVETGLVRAARAAGARVIPGYLMLLKQGAASFRIWTGVQPPEDEMERALLEQLGGGARG